MTEAVISATATSAVYSGAPKRRPASDRTGEKKVMTMMPTHPAKNEPIAEMDKATPALPWRAIGCPSMQTTTELGSPGMLSMIAVVEPAWCAP